MANRETLRDYGGRIIGYIDTQPNGDETIRNFYGQVKGTYSKNQNVTRDFYGRIVSQGNTLMRLLDN